MLTKLNIDHREALIPQLPTGIKGNLTKEKTKSIAQSCEKMTLTKYIIALDVYPHR